MTEVQAEFDELVNRNALSHRDSLKMDQLIARGAKLTYKGTYYQFFREAMMDRNQTDVIWYLNNVEYDPEFVNKIVQDVPFGDLMAYILKSKKCAFYIEKLMDHRDIDETVKANLQKLRNLPEVKTEDSSKAQMAFDALYSISHSDEKLIQNRSKLEELIAKGVKVKYCGTLLMDAIIASTDPETAIWYLNHLEPCKDVIEDIVVMCHEKYNPILEVVMRCNKCEYYLQKLAESDKVDSELRNNIKKLIKG
jgi:hypothetical protein